MAHDDWLDELLRQPAAYLEDDGFSARVVSALPAPAHRLRRLVVLGFTLAAALLALIVPPLRTSVTAVSEVIARVAVATVEPSAAASVGAMAVQTLIVVGVLVVVALWGAVALARTSDS